MVTKLKTGGGHEENTIDRITVAMATATEVSDKTQHYETFEMCRATIPYCLLHSVHYVFHTKVFLISL
jgi:hypothetical protein